MSENWIMIYSADEEFKAKVAEDVLKQHHIVSNVEKKGGSAFPPFGIFELYVPADKAEEAYRVLKEHNIKDKE